MAEIFGYPIMGGGRSSGGTLTVTGVAGSTVTVSNADESYTRTLDSTGKAIFKGLASGTWTVTMTNGTQTATRSVEITADYSVSIAYFAATINVTYPAGSMCTATDGVTTLTAPNTTGTWECIVPNAGTWTINCTDGSLSTSGSISITAAGETKTLTLSYIRYLYDNGVEAAETGGWSTTGYSMSGYSISAATKGANSITFTSSTTTNLNLQGTQNAVDLTDIDTITIELTVRNKDNNGYAGQIWVLSSKTITTAVARAVITNAAGSKTTVSIDVSSLSGSYYIACIALGTAGTESWTMHSMKLD